MKTIKKTCDWEKVETEHNVLDDKTPQGWPMVVHECTSCGLRTLQNDPEADYKTEHPDDEIEA